MCVCLRYFERPLMAVFPSLFKREYAKCNERVIGMDGNFTHSLTRSFAHSPLTHSLTGSLAHWLTHSLAHSLTRSLTHWLTRSLAHSLTRSLTHSLTHSLAHSLTCSLTHSLTHSLDPSLRCKLPVLDNPPDQCVRLS